MKSYPTKFKSFCGKLSKWEPCKSCKIPYKPIPYLHNTTIPRFYPSKNLHRHCFRFPLGHLHVPGEIANNDYAKFWGVKRCITGFVQVENIIFWPVYPIHTNSLFWVIFVELQFCHFPLPNTSVRSKDSKI